MLQASPESGTAPLVVSFDTRQVTHTSAAGSYTARPTVSDAGGLTHSATTVITAAGAPSANLPAPTNLSASGAVGNAVLRWTDTSTGEEGFVVERAAPKTGTFTVIAVLGAGVTTYVDYVSAGKQQYRVRAFAGSQTSPYSNTATTRVR